jgi:hypothetical protein
MFGMAVDHHAVAVASSQRFGDCDLGIKTVPMLIERSDCKGGSEPYRACIRRQDPGQ